MKDSIQESEESINQILSDMEKKNKKKYEDTLLIVKCLNELEKFLEKKEDLYSPLILTEKDKFNAFNLAKIQIDYYWQKVKKGNKINHYKEIYLETFELLFLGKGDFNFERLSDKISFFEIFLQAYPNDDEKKYIDKISETKGEWAEIISLLFNSFHQFGFLFCGWLDFSGEKICLFRFLVNFSKIYFKIIDNVNNEEINKVEDRTISEFFDNLISNEQNDYIKIVINNGNLEIKNQTPDEVMTSFQIEDEEEDPDLSGKNALKKIIKDVQDKIKTKKSKARKKRKKAKDKIIAKNNDGQKKEIKEEVKKLENEKNSHSNNPIPNESAINSDKEKKKTIQEEVDNTNNKSFEERIKALEKKYLETEERNIEMEKAIYFLTKKNKNLKNKHNTLRKKVKETQAKLSKVEDTVNLIQARDTIKAFIDFFYFGLKFTKLDSYEQRIKTVLGRLNSKNYIKKMDPILLSEINSLLNICDGKLKSGNDYAHKFDRNKDAIATLFSEIDPDNKCPNIRIKLEKGNANNIIFKLLYIRDTLHLNKDKLHEEEKALYDAMPPKLDSTLYQQ